MPRKKSGLRWVALTYIDRPDKDATRRVGPYLVRLKSIPGLVYWGWGPTHFDLHESQKGEIVKDYGPYREDGRDVWNKFVRDFPPLSTEANDPCEGWLSPDGTLYAFRYGEHSSTAKELTIINRYRIGHDDYEDALLDRGWINLRCNMKFLSMGKKQKPTLAQINRLSLITLAHPDDAGWQHALRYLDYYDSPKPKLKVPGRQR